MSATYPSTPARPLFVVLAGVLRGRNGTAAALQAFAVRLAVLGLNVATGVLAARWLGAAGRGDLAALRAGATTFAFLLALGLPSAVVYTFRRYPAHRGRLLGAALALTAALGAVAVVLGAALVPVWLDDFAPDVRRAAQWMMLTAPLVLLMPVCTGALEASGAYTATSRARLAQPLLTFLVLVGLGVAGAMTPLSAALAYVAASLPLAWMLAALWRRYPPQFRGIARPARLIGRYAVRSAGINLTSSLSSQADQVLVVGIMEPALVGAYVVALSATRLLTAVHVSVVAVLFSKTASRAPDHVLATVGRTVRVVGATTALAGVVLFAAGPTLLRVLYGPDFVAAATLLRLLVVEVVVGSVVSVLAQSFMALGRPGWVSTFQTVGLALNVPLLLVLVPQFGLVGAGVALLTATSVRFVAVLAAYPLVLRVPPPPLVLTRADVRALRQSLTPAL